MNIPVKKYSIPEYFGKNFAKPSLLKRMMMLRLISSYLFLMNMRKSKTGKARESKPMI